MALAEDLAVVRDEAGADGDAALGGAGFGFGEGGAEAGVGLGHFFYGRLSGEGSVWMERG